MNTIFVNFDIDLPFQYNILISIIIIDVIFHAIIRWCDLYSKHILSIKLFCSFVRILLQTHTHTKGVECSEFKSQRNKNQSSPSQAISAWISKNQRSCIIFYDGHNIYRMQNANTLIKCNVFRVFILCLLLPFVVCYSDGKTFRNNSGPHKDCHRVCNSIKFQCIH